MTDLERLAIDCCVIFQAFDSDDVERERGNNLIDLLIRKSGKDRDEVISEMNKILEAIK